jgi:hypothetical protein
MVTSSSLEFHFQHTVGTKIIEDIVVLIRLLCHKLAPSRYRVFSRMPWTKNINEIIYIFSSCFFNYAESIKTIYVSGRIINECGTIGVMITGRGNRSTHRKTALL